MVVKTYNELLDRVDRKFPNGVEYSIALKNMIISLKPILESNEDYIKVMDILLEPEKVIIFRIIWEDDKGNLHINRGFRVQHSSVLGPYKGGLRFHPSVNLSIMRALAFNQTFKNSLTNYLIGGAKGGSDFNPKGKSVNEIKRFCQAFITQLYKHIGPITDIPAGDIGVSEREINFMFGHYNTLCNEFSPTFTGKSILFGGSIFRTEATGYGLVYFADEMLKHFNDTLKGKRVLVSGAGNVAQHCVQCLIELGAIPITMSDSTGYIFCKNGISMDALDFIKNKRGKLDTFCEQFKDAKYYRGKKPWGEKADIAMPCATENEITLKDAQLLKEGGITYVIEGSNMPCTNDAICFFKENDIKFGPCKAANAGGVICSTFEMAQNRIGVTWTKERVMQELKDNMRRIFSRVYETSKKYKKEGDLEFGVNCLAFLRLAEAILKQGIV